MTVGQAAAGRAVGTVLSSDLPDLAARWLTVGLDTPALRELAGHPCCDGYGIDALWQQVLAEVPGPPAEVGGAAAEEPAWVRVVPVELARWQRGEVSSQEATERLLALQETVRIGLLAGMDELFVVEEMRWEWSTQPLDSDRERDAILAVMAADVIVRGGLGDGSDAAPGPDAPSAVLSAVPWWIVRWTRSGDHEQATAGTDEVFSFKGVSPWTAGPQLELQVQDWTIDLHASAFFLRCTYLAEEQVQLQWWHHDPALGPVQPQLVTMLFEKVRGLRVVQDEESDARTRRDTFGWAFTPASDGTALLDFSVGELEMTFRTGGVAVTLEPTDLPHP